MSGLVRIRQDASAYVTAYLRACGGELFVEVGLADECASVVDRAVYLHTSAYVSIRQHTSAYVSIHMWQMNVRALSPVAYTRLKYLNRAFLP